MKTRKFLIGSFLAVALFSCNDEKPAPEPDKPVGAGGTVVVTPVVNPKKPNKITQVGEKSEALVNVLSFLQNNELMTLSDVIINDNEYQEIKAFTDNLVKGISSDEEKVNKILKWVNSRDNIKYGHNTSEEVIKKYGDVNNPYPTFKERIAVCQGYSSLLKVMIHSQNIPCFVINGTLKNDSGQLIGGHAWNVVMMKGVWLILDPTNSNDSKVLSGSGSGPVGRYEPHFIYGKFIEDENFIYSLYEQTLAVVGVKPQGTVVTIPESVRGYTINAFLPRIEFPSNVTRINLSKNIKYLGDNAYVLRNLKSSIEEITVAAENKFLESVSGVLYQKGQNMPLYIPTNMRVVKVKATDFADKGWVRNLAVAEEVWFEKGTKEIGAFALENCVKLLKLYVPAGCKVDKDALYRCNAEAKVVEY